MTTRAIVAGATGLVGRELIRQLAQDPAYGEVMALVRRPSEWEGAHPLQVVTDWSGPSLESVLGEELRNADVYCALGSTMKKAGSQAAFKAVDLEYPLRLGRLAAKGGASRFLIVSSIGADPQSMFFYNRVKGEMEEGLRALGLPALHLFRPSLLLGSREGDHRPGEKLGEVIGRAASFLLKGKLARYKPISAADVARGMILAAHGQSPGVRIWESDEIARLSR
ncbi:MULTISPECIES: NAD(P)H-binding protein [Paenibacillus]|uniref:NAD(P)H-binding protein n=1 Tax=Paenibacillus TaxID=44249 RepID=UPI0022B923AC|nr:NAD(P)H-binding protein [Paenibacillus caseinilyticus]MCZ8523527.1 NAD(P)H-binding protein [Paenibacillus caseinilyticus]